MTSTGDDHMTLSLREHGLDWREIGEEIVVLDGQAAVYLALRGSGALLWRLLAGSTTRAGLVERVVRTYGIEATQAAADIDAFLATLDERGLLAS
jgi:hypothetical protein